ncbi:hypothetical protein ACFL1R_03610 [Candidatus Latescibacterota bacterium]
MALGAYNVKKSLKEMYSLVESFPSCRVLPWGLCIGASKVDLYATFISKDPKILNNYAFEHIRNKEGISKSKLNQIIKFQLQTCEKSKYIKILEWFDDIEYLLPRIVNYDKGVVIPSLRWWSGEAGHAIVITKFNDKEVSYNNPNNSDLDKSFEKESNIYNPMSKKDFMKRWLDKEFGCQLLIISDNDLKLKVD